MSDVDAKSVQDFISNLQCKEYDDTRASELAVEVSTLTGAVEAVSEFVGFDDEPSQFAAYIKSFEVMRSND